MMHAMLALLGAAACAAADVLPRRAGNLTDAQCGAADPGVCNPAGGCTDLSKCCLGGCSTNYDCCGMPHCCAWAGCGCDGSLCDGKGGHAKRCFSMGNCFDECVCGQPGCFAPAAFFPHLMKYRAHARSEGITHGDDRGEAAGLATWLAARGIVLPH
eukprot:TRINITY_DN2395_c0_g1_i1.p2 TRINITY_DN2395_c0_g1~~TRINITY_DN2395_c0_g1_i1.p2  ORF type:complete len:157 (+),score=38.06 TRINITY_DN2395_c0_g1_i1:45-515(+)